MRSVSNRFRGKVSSWSFSQLPKTNCQLPGPYDCDAYGNTQIFDDQSGRIYDPLCEFIFTGRRFDPETSDAATQMYYYRARYYSVKRVRTILYAYKTSS